MCLRLDRGETPAARRDDPGIARPLVRALEREGFEVEHLEAGEPAIGRVTTGDIDLVVLDLTLPDLDGLDVCRQIRARHPALPIVMLTARREEVDVVVGFDAGADDYVAKPFRVAGTWPGCWRNCGSPAPPSS